MWLALSRTVKQIHNLLKIAFPAHSVAKAQASIWRLSAGVRVSLRGRFDRADFASAEEWATP